jgi:ureidoacrylate peracid hydrolase
MKLTPSRTALLVIDMQNDFVREDAVLRIPGIEERLDDYQKFLAACRKKGVMIIYTRHVFDPKKNPIEAELFPELLKGGLRAGTSGHAIVDELAPKHDDIIIDKTRYNAFYNTDLEAVLKKRGITHVMISGTMTEICCHSTARGAMERDYHVLFLSDLNFSADQHVHEVTLGVIKMCIGRVCTAEEVEGMMG